VTTEKPDASKQAPPARAQKPPRGAHTAEFLAWCKSFAIVGTVAAVTAACPGAQVRPEPFECPAGAWELMDEKWKWSDSGIRVLLDDRYKQEGDSWLQSGPVVGVALEEVGGGKLQQTRSKKPVPVGTRFIGNLWVVPESRNGQPGYLVVRYDRVEFPNGDKAPVCLLHEGSPVVEVKDGTGRVTDMVGRAFPVYRWKPERPE
jgi:serine/threonine-protein kinase